MTVSIVVVSTLPAGAGAGTGSSEERVDPEVWVQSVCESATTWLHKQDDILELIIRELDRRDSGALTSSAARAELETDYGRGVTIANSFLEALEGGGIPDIDGGRRLVFRLRSVLIEHRQAFDAAEARVASARGFKGPRVDEYVVQVYLRLVNVLGKAGDDPVQALRAVDELEPHVAKWCADALSYVEAGRVVECAVALDASRVVADYFGGFGAATADEEADVNDAINASVTLESVMPACEEAAVPGPCGAVMGTVRRFLVLSDEIASSPSPDAFDEAYRDYSAILQQLDTELEACGRS